MDNIAVFPQKEDGAKKWKIGSYCWCTSSFSDKTRIEAIRMLKEVRLSERVGGRSTKKVQRSLGNRNKESIKPLRNKRKKLEKR